VLFAAATDVAFLTQRQGVLDLEADRATIRYEQQTAEYSGEYFFQTDSEKFALE
jgi:hypothetical protein